MPCISSDMEGMIITSSFHDSDWISIISDACYPYFRVRTTITLSPMPLNEIWGGWKGVLWVVCGTKRVTCLSVISWSSVEDLRCLFVREEWSEYLLGLWRHPCTQTHNRKTESRCWLLEYLNNTLLWMIITLKNDMTRITECVTGSNTAFCIHNI